MKPEDIVLTTTPGAHYNQTEVRASVHIACASMGMLAYEDIDSHKRTAFLMRRGVVLRLYGWVIDLVNQFEGGPRIFTSPKAQEEFCRKVRNPINRFVEDLTEPSQIDFDRLAQAAHDEQFAKPADTNTRRFRTKPTEVEAFQATRAARADNSDWPQWMHEAGQKDFREPGAVSCEDYPNSNGTDRFAVCLSSGYQYSVVHWNDWIIRHPDGELRVCTAEEFDEHFEPA